MTTLTLEQRFEALEAQNALLAAQVAAKPKTGATRIIKHNASNGIFIRDAKYTAVSKLGKSYVTSMNIAPHNLELFIGILTDKSLQADIMKVVNTGEELRK